MLRRRVLTQILIIEFAILCLFVLAFAVIYNNYQSLEEKTLQKNFERVLSALDQEIASINRYNKEWGSSGAVYISLLNEDRRTVFFRNVILNAIVGAFDIDRAAFLNQEGTVVAAKRINPNSVTDIDITAPDPFLTTLQNNTKLTFHDDKDSEVSGLINIDGDIVLVSSQPIARGFGDTKSYGAIVATKRFDEQSIAKLGDIVLQDLAIVPLSEFSQDENHRQIVKQLSASPHKALFVPLNNNQIGTYALLSDINDNNNFILTIKSTRDIISQARKTIITTGTGLLVFLLCLVLYVLFFLDRSILKRVKLLSDNVKQLTHRDTHGERLQETGNDELTALTSAFNDLLGSLEITQKLLRDERDQAETTLSSIGDAVITTDLEGKVLFINNAAGKIIKQSLLKCKNKSIDEIFRPTDESGQHQDKSLALRCIESGKSIRENEYCYLTDSDNNEVIIESLACPIQDHMGLCTGAVIVFRDISHEHNLQKDLVYQASHDPLTNVYNRAEFERQLEIVAQSANKNNQNHHLVFVDIDRFKVVNDLCGHIAGDKVLREIALLMHAHVRRSDILARIGGDEFGILLINCKFKDALHISDKLRQAISDYRFVYNEKVFTFGASIGLVNLKDQMYDTELGLLSMADQACMSAKNAGRNRVHVFKRKDSHIEHHHRQTLWVNQITEALEHDRFTLYFQKIVPVKKDGNLPVTAEILLRMNGNHNSVISPGAFLPAAERYGLMKLIDKWVIEHFCAWAHENPQVFDSIKKFSINLSGQSLSDGDFLRYINEYFSNSSIPPERIGFEITETAAIHNITNASKFIHTLKSDGFSFSLDDFGSGMSSFSYLKHLPVEALKIDGVFIKNIEREPIDYSMVKSITEIAHVMDIKTVAEFVENDNIFALIKEIGIDYAQGFHIHRPLPLTSLAADVKQQSNTGY